MDTERFNKNIASIEPESIRDMDINVAEVDYVTMVGLEKWNLMRALFTKYEITFKKMVFILSNKNCLKKVRNNYEKVFQKKDITQLS
jgi:hypothetical protein